MTNDRYGSQADLLHDITPTTAIGGKADIHELILESRDCDFLIRDCERPLSPVAVIQIAEKHEHRPVEVTANSGHSGIADTDPLFIAIRLHALGITQPNKRHFICTIEANNKPRVDADFQNKELD